MNVLVEYRAANETGNPATDVRTGVSPPPHPVTFDPHAGFGHRLCLVAT
jgi:hypothetical protein